MTPETSWQILGVVVAIAGVAAMAFSPPPRILAIEILVACAILAAACVYALVTGKNAAELLPKWLPWQALAALVVGAFVATCLQLLFSTDKSFPDPLKRALSLKPGYAKTTGSETVKKFEFWMEASNQHHGPLKYQVEGVAIALGDKVVFASGKTAEVELAKNASRLIGGRDIDISSIYEAEDVNLTVTVKLRYGELDKPFSRSLAAARQCKVKFARTQGTPMSCPYVIDEDTAID